MVAAASVYKLVVGDQIAGIVIVVMPALVVCVAFNTIGLLP